MRRSSSTIPALLPPALVPVLVAAVLLAPPPARAEETPSVEADQTDPNSSSTFPLTKDDFIIEVGNSGSNGTFTPLSGTAFDTFFDRTRCLCGGAVTVRVKLSDAGVTKVGQGTKANLALLAGNSCLCKGTGEGCCQPTLATCTKYASNSCVKVGAMSDLRALATGSKQLLIETTVDQLFRAGASTSAGTDYCSRDEAQQIWLWVENPDTGGDDPEFLDLSKAIELDGKGPPEPTGVVVQGGNETLHVSWTAPAFADDFGGYQILCSRGGSYQVFADGKYKAGFNSAAGCATKATALTASSSDASASIAALAQTMRGPPPEPLAKLDPKFVCSPTIPSGTSWQIKGLQNRIPYAVGVISLDKNGNPSQLTEVVLAAPQETRDFYGGYLSDGGQAEGGFCAVATGRGRTPLLPWLGAGLLGLGWAARRARRRRADRAKPGEAR